MKNKLIYLALLIFGMSAGMGISLTDVSAKEICFCHSTGSESNPSGSICTSNQGQQEGHTTHGDPDFGCHCGDGVCDANDGENQNTCPQDCGAPPTCGDGTANDGEECGETGIFCTVAGETCIGCRCAPPPPDCFDADDCDDNNVCNGDETCTNLGACLGGSDLTCDDGNACNGFELCDAAQGCQAGNAVVCDDGRSCSDNNCDTQTGLCSFDVSSCDCSQDADCDDGNPCTDDACNTDTGVCSNDNNDQNSCDDNNACTGNDHCGSGQCLGDGVSCDDANPCTDDACNPASGCEVTNNDTNICSDGNSCNGDEACSAGECVAGTPAVCDDGRSCSTQTCNSETGLCEFALDQCNCGSEADCSDGNACTTDTCDVDSGLCDNASVEEVCPPNQESVDPKPVVPGASNSLSGSGSACSIQATAGTFDLSFLMALGLGLLNWIAAKRLRK